MPMVSLKPMAGAARRMVVASARTTAAEIRAENPRWPRDGVHARKVRGEDRERPYRVESWVVGARACLGRSEVPTQRDTPTQRNALPPHSPAVRSQ